MTDLRKAINEINNLTNTIHNSGKDYPIQEDNFSAETEWACSHFWAKIIYLSKEQNKIQFTTLQKIHKEYQKSTSEIIDLNFIIDKGWIRIILDSIHIPATVSSACLQVEQLVSLTEDQKKSYVSIIKWRKELSFIKYIQDIKYNEDNYLIHVSKTDFEKIHKKHSSLFPQTPAINTFKLTLDSSTSSYKIQTSTIPDYSFDKIFVLLWEKAISEGAFKNDEERILYIFDRIRKFRTWNKSLTNFISQNSLRRLLDVASEIILEETDIIISDKEINKLKLDCDRDWTTFENNKYIKVDPLSLDNDIFDLYNSLKILIEKHHSNIVYFQDSRLDIGFLINLIVINDRNNINPELSYVRIKKLFKESRNRQFLLWELSYLIKDRRREVISELLADLSTAPLGFNLLFSKSNAKNQDAFLPSLLDEQIIKQCTLVILTSLKKTLIDNNTSKVIFQCILTTALNKYYTVRSFNIKEDRGIHSFFKKELLEAFTKVDHLVYQDRWHDNFYNIHESLLEFIDSYNYEQHNVNDVIGLPFVKLDLLIWFYDCCSKHSYFTSNETLLKRISKIILDSYLTINVNQIASKNVTDADGLAPKMVQPNWFVSKKRIEEFSWTEMVVILNKHNYISDFLNPCKLRFQKSTSVSDNFNRFIAEKIRTHIYILLFAHKGLNELSNNLDFLGSMPEILFDLIESTLNDFVSNNCISNPKSAEVDVFDKYLESYIWSDDHIELLPIISQSINQFKNHAIAKNIILNIVRSQALVRSLKLLQYLIGQEYKNTLIEKINSIDIENELNKSTGIDELQKVLILFTDHDFFVEKSIKVLQHWEKRLSKNTRSDYIVFEYHIKLLIAYLKSDPVKIKKITEPTLSSYRISANYTFNPKEDKDFYLALFYLKNNEPQASYNIFRTLLKTSKNERSTIALNCFAAKLKWATNEKDITKQQKLYKDAISEWLRFNTSDKPKDLYRIQEQITFNILFGYDKLNQYAEFDKVYNELGKAIQLKSNFLEIRVLNLKSRNMRLQAEELLKNAEIYHQLANGSYPEFIHECKALLHDVNMISEYQTHFLRIMGQSSDNLVQIIPESINRYNLIDEFILHELVSSVDDVLTYINSIDKIKIEDKYTDLLLLSLNGRLKQYFWKLGNQRGGFSDSNPIVRNPGERDFVITDMASRQIAVCEAMNLYGKNSKTTKKHNLKIFNYSPDKKLFFIIVYYLGQGNKFKSYWKKYYDEVISNISYPKDYKMLSPLDDLSKTFGKDAIQVGKTEHGNNTKIYHLFVNINYRT